MLFDHIGITGHEMIQKFERIYLEEGLEGLYVGKVVVAGASGLGDEL